MPATPHVRTLVALSLAGAPAQVLRRLASDGAAPGVEPPAAVWACTDDLLGSLERSGTRVTALGEPGYPAALLELPDPPPFLLVRGELPADWARAVAVVGTRDLDQYGERVTALVAGAAALAGHLVVSGGAAGADTVAHRTALERGGRTVAVLGSGFDHPFPPENVTLFTEIAEKGGAVITEYLPQVHPDRFTFPQRNRLVAALSREVVVTRAPASSGALITARLARGLQRRVWAVVGDLFDPAAAGCHALLGEGALPWASPAVFLRALGLAPALASRLASSLPGGAALRAAGAASRRARPAFAAQAAMSAPPALPPDLDEEERAVAALLMSEAFDLDELSARTTIPIRRLSPVLTRLELRGLIARKGSLISLNGMLP
jgi:DNA processing protein